MKLTFGPAQSTFYYKDNDKKQVEEWYYLNDADVKYTRTTTTLLSTMAERYRPNQTQNRILQTLGMDLIGANGSWRLASFYGNNRTAQDIAVGNSDFDYCTLYPVRKDGDPEFPEEITKIEKEGKVYYTPTIEAIMRNPVILVRDNMDY